MSETILIERSVGTGIIVLGLQHGNRNLIIVVGDYIETRRVTLR